MQMKLLQERIVKDGQIEAGNILKVDSFLNHQIDVSLLEELGKEFHRQFAGQTVNKILTIEASGIAIACIAARYFQVPVVFAKKTRSLNIAGDVYTAKVESFTHKNTNDIIVSKKFLSPGDRILIVVEQAGATLVGAGVVIEKGFQDGGKRIREAGIDLHSLAIVEEMDTEHGIRFREEML